MMEADLTRIEAELDCAQMGALILELPFSTLVVTGKDRTTWLNGLVTSDLAKLGSGDASYGLAVGKTGKIQAEVWVIGTVDRNYVALPNGRAETLRESFDRHLVMEDADLAPIETETKWALALGARASDALIAAREAGAIAGSVRRGGLNGAIIASPAAQWPQVVAAITEKASPAAVATPSGWERVRVEHAIPQFGIDFDEENNPQEAALEGDAVSFQKGCYLGQEAVFMLEKRGHPKKRLVQLMIDGEVKVGDPIMDGETSVGAVTTCIHRPGRNLALGYVKFKMARADKELTINGKARAWVTSLLAKEPE